MQHLYAHLLKPDILLLDEPFSALDYQTRLEVREDICNILRSEKKTVILVTHDISEAIAMTDRVLILTSRPAKLLKTINIESRDTLSSQKYFDEIREVLK